MDLEAHYRVGLGLKDNRESLKVSFLTVFEKSNTCTHNQKSDITEGHTKVCSISRSLVSRPRGNRW